MTTSCACSPRSPSPRVTPTRSATRSATASSTRCSPKIRTSRVAVETLVTTGLVHVAGEVTTSGYVDIPGHRPPAHHRHRLHLVATSGSTGGPAASRSRSARSRPTSPQGVDTRSGNARGQQHRRRRRAGRGRPGHHVRLRDHRNAAVHAAADLDSRTAWPSGWRRCARPARCDFLRPDGKTQVTIGYDGVVPRDGRHRRAVSTQHAPGDRHRRPARAEVELVIDPVLAGSASTRATRRPTSTRRASSTSAVPQGDAGLTGSQDHRRHLRRRGAATAAARSAARTRRRSTARPRTPCAGSRRMPWRRVSPTGSRCRSPTRSARPLPSACTSRASAPAHVDDEIIIAAIREVFDLRPASIIRELDLLRPIYAQTATYGHFGRELPDFTWEKLDRVEALRSAVRL